MGENNKLRDWMRSLLAEPIDRELATYPVDPDVAQQTMAAFGIPVTSGLGMMLAMTGGFSVGNGRLRMLGSPAPDADVRSLLDWNQTIG